MVLRGRSFSDSGQLQQLLPGRETSKEKPDCHGRPLRGCLAMTSFEVKHRATYNVIARSPVSTGRRGNPVFLQLLRKDLHVYYICGIIKHRVDYQLFPVSRCADYLGKIGFDFDDIENFMLFFGAVALVVSLVNVIRKAKKEYLDNQ